MDRRIFWALFLVLGVVSANWFLLLGGNSRTPPAKTQQELLSVAAESLDLGEVWMTDSFKWEISVSNTSERKLKVKPQGFCHCTRLEPDSLELRPGQSAKVTATFDLTAAPKTDNPTRFFDATIALLDYATSATLSEFIVHGKVRQAIELPSAVAFSFPDSPEDATKDVVLTGLVPLKELSGTSESPHVAVELERDQSDQTQFLIRIKPKRSLAVGHHRLRIRLTPQSVEHGELPTAAIWLNLHKIPDIEFLPARIVISEASQGAAEAKLVSHRNSPFTLSEVRVPQFIKCDCETLGTSNSEHLLRFTASSQQPVLADRPPSVVDLVLIDAAGEKSIRQMTLVVNR